MERLKDVAAHYGFVFRHAARVDMLLPPGETKARDAIRLIFSEEKVQANQLVPNPTIRPEHLSMHGVSVAVIRVPDLVEMKLNNNRDIDRVHVRDLDSVGLITPAVEALLIPGLRERLEEIRSTE